MVQHLQKVLLPGRSKAAPGGPQDAPRMPPGGPMTFLGRPPRQSQDATRRYQNGLGTAPEASKTTENNFKKWVQNRSSTSNPLRWQIWDRFRTDRGSIWDQFGLEFGPIWRDLKSIWGPFGHLAGSQKRFEERIMAAFGGRHLGPSWGTRGSFQESRRIPRDPRKPPEIQRHPRKAQGTVGNPRKAHLRKS